MYTNLSTCFSQIQCLVLCVCVCVFGTGKTVLTFIDFITIAVFGEKIQFMKLFFLFQILIPVILMHSRIHDPPKHWKIFLV